eukprot:1773289-Lingulodinium_polyedra.AAC.1
MIEGAWTTPGGKLDPNASSTASAGASTGGSLPKLAPCGGEFKGSPVSTGGPGDSKFVTRGVIPGAKTLKELKDF